MVLVTEEGRRRCELHKSEGAGSLGEACICTSVLGMYGRRDAGVVRGVVEPERE